MTVALELALTVVVLMLNVPVEAPAAIVTDAGTVNAALLSVRVTRAPPDGAPALSVTVQVLEAFGPSELGLHATELIPDGGPAEPAVTTPPVAVTAVALPDGSEATALATPIVAVDTLGATTIFNTARVPFEMIELLMP